MLHGNACFFFYQFYNLLKTILLVKSPKEQRCMNYLFQVSSTSGSRNYNQGVSSSMDASPLPPPAFSTTTPSPTNFNVENNSSLSINSKDKTEDKDLFTDNNNSDTFNNKNNSLNSNITAFASSAECNQNSTSTPLILNLSNIQGGGGLLILNSNTHSANPGHSQGTHHTLSAPFTLTSYFGPAHAITTTTSNGRCVPAIAIQQQQQHQQHHSQNHFQSIHQQHQHVQVSPLHNPIQVASLVKRETKDQSVDNLRVDLTNGNLAMDTGTFANLVSSLEESQTFNKDHKNAIKQSFCSIKTEFNDSSHHVKEELFSNSLSLSPEDIQKTLSANLPTNSNKSPHSVDDNPMDFIDNNMAHAEDDVLANLDAFDMLSDFPDLDHYDPSPTDNFNRNHSNSSASSSTNVSGKSVTNQSQQTNRNDYRDTSSHISDYSPEWAYPEVRFCSAFFFFLNF